MLGSLRPWSWLWKYPLSGFHLAVGSIFCRKSSAPSTCPHPQSRPSPALKASLPQYILTLSSSSCLSLSNLLLQSFLTQALILLLWIRSSFRVGTSDLMLKNIFWFPSHCSVSWVNSPFLCPLLRTSPTLRSPSLGRVQGLLYNKKTYSWNM